MDSVFELIKKEAPEGNWDAVLKVILPEFDCCTGTIHFVNEEDGLLHISAHTGIPEHILPKVEKIPIGKGIAGVAAEKREAVEICNLQEDTSGVAKPAARDTKVSGSLAVPILGAKEDVLLGTLGIGKFEPYTFSDQEKNQLSALAAEIGSYREQQI